MISWAQWRIRTIWQIHEGATVDVSRKAQGNDHQVSLYS